MPYNLLVLGPMQHRVGDTVIRPSNKRRIAQLLDQMSDALANAGGKPFRVTSPESTNETTIIELILSEIELADLVVLALTGSRASGRSSGCWRPSGATSCIMSIWRVSAIRSDFITRRFAICPAF
jgi:hypothetical protein